MCTTRAFLVLFRVQYVSGDSSQVRQAISVADDLLQEAPGPQGRFGLEAMDVAAFRSVARDLAAAELTKFCM
jgi:hypothetical protein